ncbi:pyridoxal-phosphate-dependent aminotransferase family protein [Microbulbifer halophilus]|uniref:Pyridoxal-phosphate-dependent aminotransferase family protein n=1 Tax=Microbulbifer halophilus TaxID=453963 RepID=A0ABW5EA89_9GAMM|nr:alanine--glyoxylate aminotransferase family protein [Microbulbifer halophilus]MCW8125670.1 alanine--glyoxylate aminotransferase family protein [Microbulbifer halophilus]
MSALNPTPPQSREPIAVPSVQPLHQILPGEPLLMMGAGPVPIPDAVARANGQVINHLGATMSTIIGQVKSMARYVFQTRSQWVMGIAGPGSAAMEMAISNLVWRGTRVLCLDNGYFSARMAEMCRRCGGDVRLLECEAKAQADIDAVVRAIDEFCPECVTLVQGETSNTICNRNLDCIAAEAKKRGCLTIVDAVCTLSTMPLEMDNWQIDAVITGGQKGLASIPGVSLLAFSEEAWKRIHRRPTTPVHWCLDALLAENFWHKGSYHYTAPVSGVLALHEALRLVCEEGLSERFERHQRCSTALQNGIEAMGLKLYAPGACRLNSVVGIEVPEGVANSDICAQMSRKYRVEIAGSFGLPIVRVGQMGEQCRAQNLYRTLHAIGCTMRDLQVPVDLPSAMAELEICLLRGE